MSWAASPPSHGGTLVIGSPFELAPVDPFHTSSTLSANIVDLLYDTLINLNESYEMTPQIATSWDISDDQLTWTFHLAQNLKFHDNLPLTAEDVVFTFHVLLSQKNSVYSYIQKNIVDISSPDKYTVVFKLKAIDQSFPLFLRRVNIGPKHLFQNNGEPLSSDYYKKPIGSGAFRAESFSSDQATLSAFSDYQPKAPLLDKIIFQVYKNEKVLMSKLISGEVDIQVFFDFKYLPTIHNIPHLTTVNYGNQHLFAIFLNLKQEIFRDKRVRQALNYAVQKPIMRKRLAGENGAIATTVVSPFNYFYNTELQPYESNPQKALILLQEAGWKINPATHQLEKNGQPFELSILAVEGSGFMEKLINMLADDFSQIGVRLNVETHTLNEAMQKIFGQKDFSAAIFPFSNIYPIDLDYSLWTTAEETSLNFSSYANEDAMRALQVARQASSKDESHKAYQQFQKIIHDDPPMVYLFWRNLELICNTRVHGLNSNPFRFFKDMDEVWVDSKP